METVSTRSCVPEGGVDGVASLEESQEPMKPAPPVPARGGAAGGHTAFPPGRAAPRAAPRLCVVELPCSCRRGAAPPSPGGSLPVVAFSVDPIEAGTEHGSERADPGEEGLPSPRHVLSGLI